MGYFWVTLGFHLVSLRLLFVTFGLAQIFVVECEKFLFIRRHGIRVVTRNNNTLRYSLCNLKDRQSPIETSGIYEIPCKNCDQTYIGQNKRAIKDCRKEHVSATNYGHAWKSSVSEHMIDNRHRIGELRRVNQSRDDYKLDAKESFFITTTQAELMNSELPPIISYLFRMTSLSNLQSPKLT